jgi:hypothetical protein
MSGLGLGYQVRVTLPVGGTAVTGKFHSRALPRVKHLNQARTGMLCFSGPAIVAGFSRCFWEFMPGAGEIMNLQLAEGLCFWLVLQHAAECQVQTIQVWHS